MPSSPKILLFDIETAPTNGYFWSLWKQNIAINQIKTDAYILCWAAKWLGSRTIYTDALPNYPKEYKKDRENDSKVCESLWKMMDSADIVIGHNGDGFDIARSNARFIRHGMRPPSPSRSIDTLKIAKARFSFTSNKLDWLGEHLGVGRKVKTDGFELWLGCMAGDPKAWAKMIRYNKGDVALLERVYLKLRPWDNRHPNVNAYTADKTGCRYCGSKDIQYRGYRRTLVSEFKRFQCNACGGWGSLAQNLLTKDERAELARSGQDS